MALLSLVREVYHESNGSAGARSIAAMVTTKGIKLSRWRATKLMKALNIISCQQPGHRYKKASKEHIEIPNYLDRQFAVTEPNQAWCGDVTYIWTGKRWAYLAVVLDLFSRKPVGWAMSFFPDSALTGKALSMAWEARGKPANLLYHSDQGSHYTSRNFRQLLWRYQIKQSLRRSRLTANEYVAIYHAAEPLPIWLRLAMDLAVVTGQRVGDLCKMKWSDINDNHLHIEQGKTGAKLAIPLTLTIDALNISLADTLQKCREASGSETIIASKHHDPLSPKTVSKYFTEARNASGLSFDGNPPTFHELRSLSARLYRNQIGDKFAQRLLGYKSDSMAARYRDSRGREWDKIEIDK